MRGLLKREKTKSNSNIFTGPDSDNPNRTNSSKSIYIKPELDFVSTVAKGKKIRENIRKRFDDAFNPEKISSEAHYAKEILSASVITPMAFRRNGVLLGSASDLVEGHIATVPSFTEEDSFVPKKSQFAVFPVAETKIFPPRRKAVGWQVGLRSYPSNNEESTAKMDDGPEKSLVLDTLLDKSEDDATIMSKDASTVMTSESERSKIIANTFLAEISKNNKLKEGISLPEPSREVKERYFGTDAKERFYATYQQLNSQADIFLGGYETLHEVVKDDSESNVLVAPYNIMKEEGLLSPKRQYTALETASMTEAAPLVKSPQKSALKSPDKRKRIVSLPSLQIDHQEDYICSHGHDEPDLERTHSAVQFSLHSPVGTQKLKLKRKFTNPKLEISEYEDTTGQLSYNLNSPRAVFLSGCLKHSLPPRAQVLLRKKLSSTVSLAHMGIGNQMAMVLAESLHQMPYLQVLNLCDNNLEDSGLSAVLRSIKMHPTLEILDISQNIIDDQAADALADFIGNPECKLQSLKMSDANIDDSECARFVQVLMHNRHLQELDMSNNLLGKDENLNAVQPDFETGGESLAKLLKAGLCPIKSLNLHWNMIRLEGAEVLCDSIRNNIHLVSLDFSYNALGRSAASVLGAALFENSVIEVINVANNGIDAIGSFTLFVGLRENKSVNSLIIDGNPIGEQGARMLMKVAANEGHRLNISAKNCDFSVRSSDVKFNIDDPCGEHIFNLEKPYDRAILIELLYIIAYDTNIDVASFEYTESTLVRPSSPKAGAPSARSQETSLNALFSGAQTYRVVKFEEECSVSCCEEEEELRVLKSFESIADLSAHDLKRLAKAEDHRKQGGFTVAGLKHILQTLNIKSAHKMSHDMAFTLDPAKLGLIEIHDFIEFIYMKMKAVKQRIWQLQHKPRCALYPVSVEVNLAGKAVSYFPPKIGYVKIKVVDSYDISHESAVQSYPLCESKCMQVIKIANMSTNPVLLLTYAIDSTKLYLEEAQKLYNEIIQKSDDPTPLLARVLLRMLYSDDAMRMIKCYVGNDVLKVRRLKQKLGFAFYPLIGIYSGYYILDLNNTLDRICMKKLIEKSSKNIEARRKKGLWDTSQRGQWNCFRNELGDRFISPKTFYPVPHRGKVEFDFVNIDRPHPQFCKAAGEDRLLECLLLSRLLTDKGLDWAKKRLSEHSLNVRRSLISNGNPSYKPEHSMGLAIGELMHNMYSHLALRKEARKKALKRELIKSAVVVEKKDKKKDQKSGNVRTSYYSSSASVKKTSAARSSLKIGSANSLSGAESDTSIEKEEKKVLKAFPQKLQQRVKAAAQKFKTAIQLTSRSERLERMWGHRMFEAVVESTGSDEYKSAAVLEFFEAELVPLWLYCKQIALVLECFSPIGLVPRSNLGSYRVELLIMLFDRIIDLENFELVLMVLNAEEQAAVYARIGVLNIFNPNKPEGSRSLDLSKWEERQLAKMLVHLSVVEPGDNLLQKQFIFDRGFAPMPGWDLSVTWLTDEGLPKKGLLAFDFFAGEGMQLMGCKVDIRLRQILFSLVLVGQRDHLLELHRADMLQDEPYFAFNKPLMAPVVDLNNEQPNISQPATAPLPEYLENSKPIKALDKLHFQIEALCKINDYPDLSLEAFESLSLHKDSATTAVTNWSKQPKIKLFTAEDANRQLLDGTDITWNYIDNIGKYESWASSD